jgi:ubiquinone/menaquinone biosynthesis C-methylase UbiE
MAGDNTLQVADWNGAVGEHWAAEQERTDQLIRAFGDAALAAARSMPGEHVLDVGCGCGDTSLALANSVGPAGKVLGVDVSAPMLAVARSRAAALSNLTFTEADASSAGLPGPFDLMYSRFGVMFFDAPVPAFRHLHSALRAGGRLSFVCWQMSAENRWAALPAQTARRIAGEAPKSDPHAPGPFAFGDRDRVAGILADAGFRDIALEGFTAPMYLGSTPRSAAEGAVRIGPASRVARDAGPAKLPAIIDAIEAALTPHQAADGSVSLPGNTWIVTASA